MQILKPVLFLALFLLFVTLFALTEPSKASDRSRSHLEGGTAYYPQHYLRDANQPHIAAWRYEDWTPARYGATLHNPESTYGVITQFQETGLITGRHKDKKGMQVFEVSDLFLRLADTDKRRVALTLAQAMSSPDSPLPPTFAFQHKDTDQFLGVFNYQGLQLQ